MEKEKHKKPGIWTGLAATVTVLAGLAAIWDFTEKKYFDKNRNVPATEIKHSVDSAKSKTENPEKQSSPQVSPRLQSPQEEKKRQTPPVQSSARVKEAEKPAETIRQDSTKKQSAEIRREEKPEIRQNAPAPDVKTVEKTAPVSAEEQVDDDEQSFSKRMNKELEKQKKE